MNISEIPAGKDAPEDIYVVIEVPKGSSVKYEVEKDSGAVFVDRFLFTPMAYPCDYGFIPNTLADDGDPIDVLVVGDAQLQPGVVMRARPVGVLIMEDDGGKDEKVVAVPHSKLTSHYDHIKTYEDLPKNLIEQIKHFFEHYKDLEPGKWVKIEDWAGPEKAKEMIQVSIDNMKK
ncbi:MULTISPECIES: inorganic diphosphatase [Cohaesibacter]|uniref:inorganic diphosphatase n=1 Tax=Cohaesibacter TaxID=655352 RepID=UPI000DE95C97|nr:MULTISPECIES: inorganic diphosphatase [Cohaesibacter]TLP47027.1 inorganic diphosphatase [Cohaesibacter sp. CAU 1516]